MGTNYYLSAKPDCECCGRPFEHLHIGKSSAGWRFSLHVDPSQNINDLADWQRLWAQPGAEIRDEYHRVVTPEEMLSVITERSWKNGVLLKHQLDGRHCVKNGEGTWDCIIGEFS
jgi:hypothetical protein